MKKQNLTKIGDTAMRVPFKEGRQNSNFLTDAIKLDTSQFQNTQANKKKKHKI